MTCIVAIWDDSRVHMGGDSAATDPHTLDKHIISEPKVFRHEDYLVGMAGNPMIGQIIRSDFVAPENNSRDNFSYISGPFINALAKTLGVDIMPGQLLIGYRGTGYEILPNFYVTSSKLQYASIGSGSAYALGSLANSSGSPQRRIEKALTSAVRHNAGCEGPFTIKSI